MKENLFREVKVGKDEYGFYLVPAQKAFKASRKLIAKVSTLLPSFTKGEITEFNSKLNDLILEDLDELMEVFIDKNNLRCNGKIIEDFDEHFAGRFMEIPKLLYKVILENDRDFFTSLPGLIEKALHTLNAKLQANSLPKADKAEEVLTKMANNLKENLG